MTAAAAPARRPAAPGGVDIGCVRVGELEAFAARTLGALRPGDVVPVARTWARALARNPHARADEVALVTARADDRWVGYLTLVPGLVATGAGDGRVLRLSACYVAPEHRGRGVGAWLLLRALGLGADLVATGFSDDVRRLYEALRFTPLGPLRALRADLKPLNLPGLGLRAVRKTVRAPRAALDATIAAADALARRVVYGWLVRRWPLPRGTTVARVDAIPAALVDAAAPRRPHFRRDAAEIAWMLRHPWVTTRPAESTPGWHFRDYDPLFAYFPFTFTDAAGRAGFAILRTDGVGGRRNVTVFDHAGDPRIVLALAVRTARAAGADVVTVPASCAAGRPFRPVTRDYFFRDGGRDGGLAAVAAEMELALADGDVAFA